MTEQIELEAWDWMAKVTERLTFLRLRVLDHRDITDEDYCLLKILYRTWWNGEYPITAVKMEGITESVIQNSLFSDGMSEESSVVANGTEFDNMVTETINETEDEKEI
jgi:hypothetical protein